MGDAATLVVIVAAIWIGWPLFQIASSLSAIVKQIERSK